MTNRTVHEHDIRDVLVFISNFDYASYFIQFTTLTRDVILVTPAKIIIALFYETIIALMLYSVCTH